MSPESEETTFLADLQAEKADSRDQQIAELQTKLDAQIDARKEDSFLWILGVLALVDTVTLGAMDNWSAPIVIGLIQLVGVTVLADRLGIDTVAPLIDRLTGAFASKKE